MSQEPVAVTGVHLKRIGDHAVVSVEIDGKWVDIIKEHVNGPFSHFCEPSGIRWRMTHPIKQSTYGSPVLSAPEGWVDSR
jgi:hypothetical protein